MIGPTVERRHHDAVGDEEPHDADGDGEQTKSSLLANEQDDADPMAARAMSSFHVRAATRKIQYHPLRFRDAISHVINTNGIAIVSG